MKKLGHVTLLLFCLTPFATSADGPDAFTAEKSGSSLAQAIANADTDTNGDRTHNAKAEQVPVLKRLVRIGENITADDIMYENTTAGEMHGNIITDSKDLIGKSPKHNILQERPIHQEEVSSPAILHKGTRVTMIYRTSNLEIRTLGEALDNGAKGDVVRVKNLSSKAIINGVVVNADTIRISSPESNSAEAM